jgi:hypothetical protein
MSYFLDETFAMSWTRLLVIQASYAMVCLNHYFFSVEGLIFFSWLSEPDGNHDGFGQHFFFT